MRRRPVAMLTITPSLLSAFREETMGVFVDEMVDYCRTSYEQDCEHLDDDVLEEIVKAAIAAAANHGFTLRGPVRLYIELSFMFGVGFDTDPQYLWLTKLLHDEALITEEDRAEALHEAVCDYVDAVDSDGFRCLCDALERLSLEGPFDEAARDELEAAVVSMTREADAQKADYLGEQVVRDAALAGLRRARQRYGLRDPGACAAVALLGYFLGHHCDVDAMFSWVTPILTEIAAADMVHELAREARYWLIGEGQTAAFVTTTAAGDGSAIQRPWKEH